MAANGGFFPSGPPHHQPPGAGVPPFSPSQGPTGFYMPGSHRTDSSEPWAEGGKPPRRRKKVRKPFQRWSLQISQRLTAAQQMMATSVCQSLYCWHTMIGRERGWRGVNLQSEQLEDGAFSLSSEGGLNTQPRWCFTSHFTLFFSRSLSRCSLGIEILTRML